MAKHHAVPGRKAKVGLIAPIEDHGQEGEVTIEEDCEPIKQLPDPGNPTDAEIESHRCDHRPFRSWCEWCIKGRGVGIQHRHGSESSVPRVGIDYFFITQEGVHTQEEMEKLVPDPAKIEEGRKDGRIVKCILARCYETKAIFAHVVPQKGLDEDAFVAQTIAEDVEWMTHSKVILKSDSEHAIKALRREIMKRLRAKGIDVAPESPQPYDSKSNRGRGEDCSRPLQDFKTVPRVTPGKEDCHTAPYCGVAPSSHMLGAQR